jgi:endonuclease YncB( thermonuclease family)
MKRAIVLAVLVLVLTVPLTFAQGQTSETGRAIRAVDGDTITVWLNGEIVRVRYIGINTPEDDQACFQIAKNANAALVTGQEVTLVQDRSNADLYGRLLRYVYVGDTFVNAELVRQGYAEAVEYPPDTAHAAEFNQLEQEAIRENLNCQGLGVFQVEIPTTTWHVASASRVNVRSCGSTDCGIVATAAPGEALEVISTADDWHMIRLADGTTGYIAVWLTTMGSSIPQPTQTTSQQTTRTGTCTVQGNNVNLRTGPGVNYGIAGTLASRTPSRVIGRNSAGDWYVVTLNARQTWVYSSVVTVSGNCSNLSVIQAPPPPTPQPAPVIQSAPQSQPVAPAQPAGTSCPGMNYTCSQFAVCAQAYACLNAGNNKLDRDHDGVPCESICPGG